MAEAIVNTARLAAEADRWFFPQAAGGLSESDLQAVIAGRRYKSRLEKMYSGLERIIREW